MYATSRDRLASETLEEREARFCWCVIDWHPKLPRGGKPDEHSPV